MDPKDTGQQALDLLLHMYRRNALGYKLRGEWDTAEQLIAQAFGDAALQIVEEI